MNSEDRATINKNLKSYTDIVVEMQTKLTAIPAIGPENGGQGEMEKSIHIRSFLEELNCDELIDINAPDDRVESGFRPNIMAVFKGVSDKRRIWIMSHMDIVPPGNLDSWDTDPYTVTVKDDRLYGRGTEDDQQGFVSSFLAMKALLDAGIRPRWDVGLALVADEETGSKYGIQYVLETRPDLFRPDDIIIIPDAGDEAGIEIEVAEKSILWVKCSTKGKQTHGSTPEKGINAHKAAAHFITSMEKLYQIFAAREELYNPPISTFEPTRKESNVENINTIPGNDVVYYDCRILPSYDLAAVKKQIRLLADEVESSFGVEIELTYPQEEQAPPSTPMDSPAVGALARAIKTVTGREGKPVGIGGGTVAAYFRQKGLPAVCWCTLDDTLHAPNEYSKISNILNDAMVFAHVYMDQEI